MGCAESAEDCGSPEMVPYCCDDLRCTKEPEYSPQGFVRHYKYRCRNPSSQSKVGEPLSHTMREKAVGGGDFNRLTCKDDDAGLVDFATMKGFSGVVGCSDATRFCSRDKVVDLCPATCAVQSGCDQLQKSLLVESVVESPSGVPEMAVFALAIVGGISIVSKIFTACTRNKEEYKAVLEEKTSEEI